MKITFVLPGLSRYPIGGYKVVYEYANYFAKHGNDVIIVHVEQVHSGRVSLRIHAKNLALRTHLMGIKSINWFSFDEHVRLKFVSDFDTQNFPDGDCVIATAWYTAREVEKLPEECGRKFYFIQHFEVFDGPEDDVKASWRLPLTKIVIASWLQRIGDQLGVRTELVTNFVDHKMFYPTQPLERKPAISMLVHHMEWKGSKDGLSALKLLTNKWPDLDVYLFGLPKPITGLPENFHYYQAASPEVLRDKVYGFSTIYLFPSHFEGWGLTATEAMACGNALVSTNNGGIDDFGIEGKNAKIVPVGDVESMFKEMDKLLQNREQLLRMQSEAIKAVGPLSIETSGSHFLKVLANTKG